MQKNTNEHRAAIEKRAYEIYLERGASDGNDLEDWLTAEREIASSADSENSAVQIPRSKVAIATRILENTR